MENVFRERIKRRIDKDWKEEEKKQEEGDVTRHEVGGWHHSL